eukprot:scaffold63087_cov68-Phaeocystis_antarctica.AAC.2
MQERVAQRAVSVVKVVDFLCAQVNICAANQPKHASHEVLMGKQNLVHVEHHAIDNCGNDHDRDESRRQPLAAPSIEAQQEFSESALPVLVMQQRPRHDVARDYEEHVNAREAARKERAVGEMVSQHHQHTDAP